ncbi:aminodeoxychorismate lyase [Pseudidiomarina sp. 1ASP75-14]|uniref:aminodeoxychorismate lyase n=1 Tax=Pseudidiomarina terrestris TaxID=2820060 RepID=UPI0026535251|nr:aminodeoxychorismate lyase [Pseudidiomarina sp. 1ASP75-14]MDN7137775.1 aminodeoxychorismate lyase [Pseudidiomarina sp. 1ASP75-14]
MWHNGQQYPDQALDRGLQFGDGHFTTLTVENGSPRWWPLHWQRLQQASERLQMLLPPEHELLDCIAQLIKAQPQQDLVIKIIITRGIGDRGYGFQPQSEANWYLTCNLLMSRSAAPLRVDFAQLQLSRSVQLAGLKSLNRLEQVLLSQERAQRQLDELIALDTAGEVVEAISSNIIWREGNHWYTPDLGQAGIAGVVRGQLLEQQPLALKVQTGVRPEQLLAAEQVLLTNSVLGLRPIAQIGEHRVSDPTLPEALKNWWHASDVSY